MRYLIAILCPPLAVLSCERYASAFLNVFLTLLFYVPGLVHALLEVNRFYADRRHHELVRAIAASQGQPDTDFAPQRPDNSLAKSVMEAAFVVMCLVVLFVLWIMARHGAP